MKTTHFCKAIGCNNPTNSGMDFCMSCFERSANNDDLLEESAEAMSKRYPAYYKDVSDLAEIDVYGVHHIFQITDPSGCIHHASKKLLLSGVRTGGKSVYKDIREARDTLTRWLHLNELNQNI